MDKQLLNALDNLSVGLEALAEALKQKNAKSSTGAALQSGNFEKSLESITVELQSIKKDTQEILKNQQTIIALQKKKDSDKKTGELEDAGGGKKESAIKKGVTTILLIAVAVLAIGLAFKLVGKIDFLSVIGLSAAIWVMSLAFERISKLKLTIKEAAIGSAVMVIGSLGIMISSHILSKIAPISMPKMLTALSITLLFLVIAPAIAKMIKAMTTPMEVEAEGIRFKTAQMDMGTVIKSVIMLPLLMVGMSAGIALSSMILKKVVPISIPQALTAVLIAAMFAVAAKGMAGLITALTTSQEAKGGGFGFKTASLGMGKVALAAVMLPFIMVAIATGITYSSRVLSSIRPIGFMQALTAILIAGMFAVVSLGIAKLINSLNGVNPATILLLPVLMLAIAAAIAGSAFIFFKAKPYFDGIGFMTTLRILLVGVTMGVIAVIAAYALKTMGNVSWKTVLQVPTLFTLMALGIAISAFVLAKAKSSFDQLTFGTIFRILLLGAAIAIVSIIVAFTAKIMGNVPWSQIIKIPVFYTLIALAIAASAFILAKATSAFNKMTLSMLLKMAIFGVVVAIAVAAMGLVIKLFKMLGIGVKDAIKGGIAIVAIAVVITATSLILNLGNYKKYPPLKWVLGVAAGLTAFGVGALLLGSSVFGPQALVFLAGLGAILLVAATIVATSHILAAGEYKKFPTLKWVIGTAAAMGLFGGAAILLGFNAINPFFYAGLGIILLVAETIVEVSDILKNGKYNLPGLGSWAASVALLFTIFTPLIITLGAVGMAAAVVAFFGGGNPFESGRKMLSDIAWSIVDVSKILQKGKYTGGPTKEWAQGVSIALGAFAPVYKMLVDSAIFDALGMGGVGPDEFAKAIKTVAKGITVAALYFAKNKSAFLNGPPVEWAKGVSLAIGGFAPAFKLMENFPFTGGQKIAKAMVHVARAIVEVADVLSKSGGEGKFKKGTFPSKKWGQGVGAAINAFAPVFKALHEDTGWFTSGDTVIKDMRNGIIEIAYALADAGMALSGLTPEMWQSYPSSKWAKGVSGGVSGFLDLFDTMNSRGYSAASFSVQSMVLKMGIKSMADVARILWTNKKYFTVKLDPNFIKNISKNVLGFASLAFVLDKLLVTEKTITSTSSGLFSSSSSTKTVKERRDLGLVKDVALQMSSVAYILWKSKKFFSFKISPDWIGNLSKNLLGYVGLQKKLESGGGLKSGLMMGLTALNPAAGLLFAGASALIESNSDDAVTKAAKKLVKVANILYSGRKAFELKLDPFFMRKIGQNLLDFNFVIKKLAEQESKGSTFMGRMGSSVSSLFGADPISQIAHRMITLAKGYDAMARSLLKLGVALRVLNIKSLQQLGSITKGFTGQGSMPEVKTERPQRYGRMFGEDQEGESIKKKKKETQLSPLENKKNQILYVSQQMEKVVKLLQSIDRSTSTIDDFIAMQSNNKIMSPPELKT